MESDQFKKLMAQKALLPKIIWGAILVSTIIYGVVLAKSANPAESKLQQLPQEVFLAMAFVSAIASLAIKQLLTSPRRLIANLQKEIPLDKLATHPKTGHINAQRLELLKSLNKDEINTYRLYSHLFVPYILSWVFAESVAIYGFVAAYPSRDINSFYPYALATIVLLVLAFPNFDRVIANVKADPEYMKLR
ncbi:MAG: hypothetical protein DCC75_13520 [Proteobacteria bacterium]|nr:MAG: hypothetical protein DCC75_13520 [Pseudomonadota bacterium]